MACESYRISNEQTEAERREEIDAAIAALEADIAAGKVTVRVGEQGAVAFEGWAAGAEKHIADSCAALTLQYQGSWAYTQAVQAAAAACGTTYSPAAVAAGIHSHDGGATWSPGHGHGH